MGDGRNILYTPNFFPHGPKWRKAKTSSALRLGWDAVDRGQPVVSQSSAIP